MVIVSVRPENILPIYQRWVSNRERFERLLFVNFVAMGKRTAQVMREKMEPAKFTGEMQRKVTSEVDIDRLRLSVGSDAKQGLYVFYGTKPHWAPIEPLKKWAKWKLGDENAAWAIQRSIAKRGTNMGYKGLKGGYVSIYGVGLNYIGLTLQSGKFKTALLNTARRLGFGLAASLTHPNWYPKGEE